MKKIIIVIIVVFISISYLGAVDKKTVDPVNDKSLMPLKGYLPLPIKHKYYFYKKGMTRETEKADFFDCIEGQRRIIGYGRLSAGDEQARSYPGYHSTVWVTIQCMENKGYVGKKHQLIEDPDHHKIHIRKVKLAKSY
jgi:hypothetical protein